MDRSELLIKYGFIKKDKKEDNYFYNEETGEYEPVEGYKLNKKDADEEHTEVIPGQYDTTGFPAPKKTYRLSWEVYDLSLEEPYFWVLDYLKQSFPLVEKLEDSFAAAENSAFFGLTQQRLGAQQDKVTQFLVAVGKMIKELFQMVRELRIIDERLDYYDEAEKELDKDIDKRGKSAEITLKGMFVDLVQGGGKSAASVYGMARELEFITLPDLFFDAPPFKSTTELENHVQSLEKDFNRNVLRVLVRHLRQFLEWKKRTAEEHRSRKRFMLAYLKQHYEIIQMYLVWIKPYLRHVSKLTMKEKSMTSPDIISAFEGSMLDIEILASKKDSGANGCLLATFNYRTRPELKVVQEGYQRGPVHIGKFDMTLRVYGWKDKELANYKKMKDKETMELLKDVSSYVQSAMESLGKELEKYLREAKGAEEKKEKKPAPASKKTLMEQFLGDFYTAKKKTSGGLSSKELMQQKEKTDKAMGNVVGHAKANAWIAFHTFKKAHQMIAW